MQEGASIPRLRVIDGVAAEAVEQKGGVSHDHTLTAFLDRKTGAHIMCTCLPQGGNVQEKELYLLALTSIRGAGPITINRIVHFFGDTRLPFNAQKKDLLRVEGLQESIAEDIIRIDPIREAEKLARDAERSKALILTILDNRYPTLLKEIYDPPPVIYYKGHINDNLKIAIVGTRNASPYGTVIAEMFGSDCASLDLTVVSGLARGIDTAAHRGALEGRSASADDHGRTIAVLGCGFDHVYPKENRKLAGRIAADGAVITEFPPDTQPFPENFPRRNRIISGLSVATIVIEAEEKSGALITARYALEQGREVFAVPGNITSRKSIGPNRLIQDGATPLLGIDDILAGLSQHFQSSHADEETIRHDGEIVSFTKNLHLQNAKMLDSAVPLDPDERTILSLLSMDVPLHIDRIVDASRISISRLLGAVLSLELKGLVDQLPGNHYIKKLKR